MKKPRRGEHGRASQATDIVCLEYTRVFAPVQYTGDLSSMTRQKKWQEANPIARWAHIATASAIRRGLIKRQPCEVCGAEKTDAHHENHRDPLNVRFLCRRHHSQLHARERRE